MKTVKINTEYIKLDSFLKLANLCSTGGEAKQVVQNSEVLVNDEVCIQRGKKLHKKDMVSLRGDKEIYLVG